MRLTYAQQTIQDLLKKRVFTKWASENGLNATSLYRTAFSQREPTYKLVVSASHLIPPLHWFYYTDEEIPYPVRTVPPKKNLFDSKFLNEHKFEYKAIAEKYNFDPKNLYPFFIQRRSFPTLAFIKTLAVEYDPTDFFVDSEDDVKVDEYYIPHQGDLVTMNNNTYLIVSDYAVNKKLSYFTGCLFLKDCDEGVILSDLDTKFDGKVCCHRLQTYFVGCKSVPSFLTRVSKKDLQLVLDKLKEVFNVEKD